MIETFGGSAHRSDGLPACLRNIVAWIQAYADFIDVAAVVSLAIAASLAVSRNMRAFVAHAHNYRQMGILFTRALTVSSSIPADGQPGYTREIHDEKFQDLVRELGREALSENAEWLMDHRDREVEPGP